MVIWAPKRSEFFTMPPQDNYAQEWLEQLAIHEFRHIVQMDKLNQGITKILGVVLGEQAVGAVSALLPGWFYEGDAVATETALSHSGRGRLPSFYMPLRAQFLEKKIYSLEKAYFGSYKDFVPNHYVLGYHLMAGIRKNYGAEVLNTSVNYVARNPFPFSPFSRGLKRATGKGQWELYDEVMTELDSVWSLQYKNNSYTPFDIINKEKKVEFTNYKYPQFLNDSTIIAEKAGLGTIQKFIAISKTGEEEVIYTPGFSNNVTISCKNNKITWWEYNYDIRWQNRVYSDIWVYDILSKKKKRVSTRKHYFSPALSNEADRIAAIHISPINDYTLEILDATTGEVLDKIVTPGNYVLFTPSWSDDDTKVLFVYLTPEGKGIASYDLYHKELSYITSPSAIEIALPVLHKNIIYFQAAYSGIDNIYALDMESDSIYQVTSARFGAFHPSLSPDGKTLYYTDYTAMGSNVVTAPLDRAKWIPLQSITINKNPLTEPLVAQEYGPIDFTQGDKQLYQVTRYRKLPHLFNFHSWSPVYLSTADYGVNPGVTFLSQNKLSTSVASVGYEYSLNEQAGRFKASYSYTGFFPMIDLSYSFGDRGGIYRDSSYFNWRESTFQISTKIPLNLTHGKYLMGVTPNVGVLHLNISHKSNTPDEFRKGNAYVAYYQLTAYRQIKTAYKDIAPRWAQSITVNYRQTLKGNLWYNPQFSAEGKLFVPGVIKHHSTKLTLSHFSQPVSDALNFLPVITFPRGYILQFNNRLYKTAIDYKFPLCYPDWGIRRLMYLPRIKANLFADYAIGYNRENRREYQSVGLEMIAETYLLEFAAPFDLGFRYFFHPSTTFSGIQFLVSVNLGSL
ncbi:MAG TPA: hypothetical protein VIK89_14215 [Cytophagaceae bacterium]